MNSGRSCFGMRHAAAGLALLALLASCAHRSQAVQATTARDVERGDLALQMGHPEDALDAYHAALALSPGDPAGLEGVVRAQLARGDGQAALAALQRLELEDPGSVAGRMGDARRWALFLAAESRLRRGDPSGALWLLRGLDPAYPGRQALLVEVLIAESGRLQVAGRTDEAAELLREAVGAEAGEGDLAFALASTLVERGRVNTAISVLSDALLRHPDEPHLQALMDRSLRIRYPRGFPD